nr:adenosylcobinamide-GDP ribazoletransferase [Tetragenococcus halophilus]
MASFFKKGKSKCVFLVYMIYLATISIFIIWFQLDLLIAYLLFILVFLLAGLSIAKSIMKNFNGITGDTLGASSEGMELLLWLTLLLLRSYAMV